MVCRVAPPTDPNQWEVTSARRRGAPTGTMELPDRPEVAHVLGYPKGARAAEISTTSGDVSVRFSPRGAIVEPGARALLPAGEWPELATSGKCRSQSGKSPLHALTISSRWIRRNVCDSPRWTRTSLSSSGGSSDRRNDRTS